MDQMQPPPPNYWPEFHGFNPWPPYGQSIFNFPRIGGGYSNPVRHFGEGGAAVSPFDSPLPKPKGKPTKIVLTPAEVAFCKQLGIHVVQFARHKRDRGLS
jgi:hypothetical protein